MRLSQHVRAVAAEASVVASPRRPAPFAAGCSPRHPELDSWVRRAVCRRTAVPAELQIRLLCRRTAAICRPRLRHSEAFHSRQAQGKLQPAARLNASGAHVAASTVEAVLQNRPATCSCAWGRSGCKTCHTGRPAKGTGLAADTMDLHRKSGSQRTPCAFCCRCRRLHVNHNAAVRNPCSRHAQRCLIRSFPGGEQLAMPAQQALHVVPAALVAHLSMAGGSTGLIRPRRLGSPTSIAEEGNWTHWLAEVSTANYMVSSAVR